jgi:hypothetical protein
MKLHKLYKLSVIVGNNTVERGVWADRMTIVDNTCLVFIDSKEQTVAVFPANLTFITSIETAEEVEERRKAMEEKAKNLYGLPPRK